MTETFSCPDCGAPLEYPGGEPLVQCPYCGTSVVVPKSLRPKPAPVQATQPSPQPQATFGSAAADRRARKAQAKRGKERQKAQEKLKKLKELHAANGISQSDYEQQRAEILKEL